LVCKEQIDNHFQGGTKLIENLKLSELTKQQLIKVAMFMKDKFYYDGCYSYYKALKVAIKYATK
jgi:hypothetical protein